MRILHNKKAMDIALVVSIVILLLVACWSIWFFGTKSKDVNTPISEKLKCGGIIGMGACTDNCDTSTGAQSFKNSFGCPPKNYPNLNICCISLEKGQTVGNYCGNDDYNFKVLYTGSAAGQTNCQKDPNSELYRCSGSSVKVKVGVESLGLKDMQVAANPRVVADNKESYLYGTPQLLKSKQVLSLEIAVAVQKGITYTINPAAKCMTQECKNTCASGGDGVFRINQAQQITIIGT